MLQIPTGQMTEADRAILRRLRVWIAALAVACLVVGVGLGALLTGTPTVAQNEAAQKEMQQVARAPEALSASFAEIARRVEPAVVNIDTVQAAPASARTEGGEDGDDGEDSGDNPLLDMLRRHSRRPVNGVGSGFIVDPKGLVVTNQHVVEGATRITVKLQTGETLRGEVIGTDEETDLAVVRVRTTRELPVVRFGDSEEVAVGDWVLAIGSPFGLDQTVTAGIISTKERSNTQTRATQFQRFLQTDAAINRGNSGGPLVNMRGEVIGVNSQIATSTGDYNGIGFALPSNVASMVFRQLISEGRVRRGYLGVYLDSVGREFARVYELPEAKGAIVKGVADEKGPAAKAGLLTNDIIVEFNGQQVTDASDLINKVAATQVGQTVQVAYLRETADRLERRTATVTIAERPPRSSSLLEPEEKPQAPKPGAGESRVSERPSLGLTLSELTPQLARERNLKDVRGLLVKGIDPAGIAYEGGLRRNMIVLRINRTPVATLADFERVVNALKPGDAVVMNVVTANGSAQEIVQFIYQ